jgi:predicted MPP superfamily phosphohydrolase
VIALVQGSRAPAVRSYDVQIANLPPESDGTVVLVASDLHLGTLTAERWLSSRVDQINAERPDLIVLAGDSVEGHGESGREFLPVLRRLSAPLGIWAVNGNHETYGRLDEA